MPVTDQTHVEEELVMASETKTVTADNTLPCLVIHHPTCGHCGEDVQIEDGYASCRTCRIQWDDLDEFVSATPDPNEEGAEAPCGIVLTEQHVRPEYDYDGKHWSLGPKQPCILPSNHESDHLNPHTITITPLMES